MNKNIRGGMALRATCTAGFYLSREEVPRDRAFPGTKAHRLSLGRRVGRGGGRSRRAVADRRPDRRLLTGERWRGGRHGRGAVEAAGGAGQADAEFSLTDRGTLAVVAADNLRALGRRGLAARRGTPTPPWPSAATSARGH